VAPSLAPTEGKTNSTPKAPDSQDPGIVKVRQPRPLPITVVDKKGLFCIGLDERDFQVLEDKIPQQIETFSDDVGQSLPSTVAVLMDTSSSTLGKLKFEQESAMNFIQLVVRPRKE